MISNIDNDYDAFIVDYNITEEAFENMQNTNINDSVVDFYPIDYDSSFFRNEQFNCNWSTHEWVFNDYVIWVYDITCTYNGSSGGESNNNGDAGNTDLDGNPIDTTGSGTQGSGGPGTGVDFNNPPILTAPIVPSAAEQLAFVLNMPLSDLIEEYGVWVSKKGNEELIEELKKFILNNCQDADLCSDTKDFSKEILETLNEDLSTYTELDYPGKDLGYEFKWWLDSAFVENNFSFELDDEGFGDLTAQEKLLVVVFPAQALLIRANKQPAETETQVKFGGNGRNDKSDAFRHAFFNAMNSNDVGLPIAKLFSDAHESENPPNLILEEQMDLFNNDKGLTIGFYASALVSGQELSNSVYQSLLNGLLVYLSPLSAVIPPNYGINNSTQITPTNQ